MWPDRVSNPGPLTYESGAVPTALRGPAKQKNLKVKNLNMNNMAKISSNSFAVFILMANHLAWCILA